MDHIDGEGGCCYPQPTPYLHGNGIFIHENGGLVPNKGIQDRYVCTHTLGTMGMEVIIILLWQKIAHIKQRDSIEPPLTYVISGHGTRGNHYKYKYRIVCGAVPILMLLYVRNFLS